MGVELRRLADFTVDEDQRVRDSIVGPTGDRSETTLALQWTSATDYLGYKLLVQSGFRLSRTSEETVEVKDLVVSKGSETTTGTTTFITVYAGVER
jgi:hypothetical protein